ncbi:oligosaccharide flippase family protein [Phocaeicola coprophilus]|uniref:oligosaccharide flippase family protein n=1 Tax=Phocaeicola coprophilus TaxID=387090 RepID=UPI00352142F3
MPNLVKNSTIYALGDILPKLFSFITFPILTSYLTPAEYGILNYVNTLNVFLLVFFRIMFEHILFGILLPTKK